MDTNINNINNINTHKLSIRSGVVAGLSIFSLLAIIDQGFHEIGLLDKFLKYILLFIILGATQYYFKSNYQGTKFFRRAMLMGVKISAIAGFSLLAANFIYWLTTGEMPVDRFYLNDQNIFNVLVLQVTTFFEMFVAGFILNFVWLQFFKGKRT